MNKLEGIKEVLIERGIMNDDWRMKIINREIIANSDFGKITIEIYQPRKRKPCIVWELTIYIPRNQIYFDKSTFYRP